MISRPLNIQGEQILIDVPAIRARDEEISNTINCSQRFFLVDGSSKASQHFVDCLRLFHLLRIEEHIRQIHDFGGSPELINLRELVREERVPDSESSC